MSGVGAGRKIRRQVAAISIAAVAAVVGSSVSYADGGSAGGNDAAAEARPEDAASGLEYRGLVRDARCGDGYLISDAGGVDCTHGPDPAPAGVDVTRGRTTDELVAGTYEGAASATASSVPCYGDGVSGKRVQAVYAYADDVPNRAAEVVDLIAGWVGNVDRIFTDSAAKTGGLRHVRWVTSDGCRLSVEVVRLTSTGDDLFGNTLSEVKAAGLTAADRKYLVWVDTNRYCGISQFRNDDSTGSANASELATGYARVDTGCWGLEFSVEAHELMHLFGGVQDSAPHSTGAGHCTEEQDRMCYTDSQTVVMSYVCTLESERLFDCGNDDYFHTAPPAGSYLAGHWNPAMTGYLERTAPTATSTSDPPPSTTTTTAPTATIASQTSATWSGSLNRKTSAASYTVTTGTGSFEAKVTFSKAKSLTVTVKAADGSVLAQRSGPSPLTVTGSLVAGASSFTVTSGGSSATFTLTASYPAP